MSAAIADLLIELVASLLGFGVRRHDDALICATRRAVSFPRPRGFATAGTQKYHAQACSLGVSEPGVTERILALMLRAKHPHCSACERAGGRTPALTRQLCRRCTPLRVR